MNDIIKEVLTEYGAFVSYLVLSNGVLLVVIKTLWKQNTHLSEKLLETVENNTKVLTRIDDKLESNEH